MHLTRFGVIMLGLLLVPPIGITEWYADLFVNVLCAGFAAGLVTYLGPWSRIGFISMWRGRRASLFLVVPLGEALLWCCPWVSWRSHRDSGCGR